MRPRTALGRTDRRSAPVGGAGGPGVLAVRQLTLRYGRLVAVDSVSFTVAAGEHVAVTGANGSGKSTLLRALAGLQKVTTGVITVDDTVVSSKPERARRLSAWVPQRLGAGRFPLLVDELLDFSGDPAAARATAVRLGLGELLRRPLWTLSGGQLQRAFVARAIGSTTAGARVLLADEPTAALDFDGQHEIAQILRELHVTVVAVTHDRAVVAACDRQLEMAAGALREVR